MKILILKGLPASGKTTYAREFCQKNKDWVRVNRDDLRNMRGEYWLPKQERMITDQERMCIAAAITHGKNVIVDATNLNKDNLASMKLWLKEHLPHELKFETMFFDVPVEECIKRDLKRPNSVGEKVIKRMYEKYLSPAPVKYTENPNLAHCIICDIDGTLALKGKRSPFDWDRVGEDKINPAVRSILQMVMLKLNQHIFLFSGRDSVCEDKTRLWLKENGVPYDVLLMRPQGNIEKDAIIKRRMFEQYIRGRFYVDFVVDDRKQCKRMWVNELGLFVFDVNQKDEEF